MKILITGTSGFIGSHLLRAVCNVYGSDNVVAMTSQPPPFCESIVYRDAELSIGPEHRSLLKNVDVLIHLGAFTPKNGQQANLICESNSNIQFTEKLLALLPSTLKKIIYISTLDVYEAAELTDESTATLPATLYGWSKLYCEQMADVFSKSRNIVLNVLRVGHVYGPGEEKYSKFLPTAINSILSNAPIELWGDGSELRSYIYVDDVVAAILQAINLADNVGPINVVSGQSKSIREILEIIISIGGRSTQVIQKIQSGNKRNYVFDNSKLRKYLLPKETPLEIGLRNEFTHLAGRS